MSILSAVGRYIDAWNVRDANAIVQSFHSDGTYEDPVTAKPIAGSAIGVCPESLECLSGPALHHGQCHGRR
jgi:hypothetical protein